MVANTAQVDWPAIQEAYSAGTTCHEIAKTHEVSEAAILKRARKEAWDAPERAVDGAYWLQRVVHETDTAIWQDGDDKRAIALNGGAAKCTPENAALILGHVANGATPSLAAGAIGINRSTISRWRKNDPKLDALIEECVEANLIGYEANIARVASHGDYKASLAALKANKRSRDYWRDPDQDGRNTGITVNISLRSGDDKPDMVNVTPKRELTD